jgi:hypothetical protein
MGLEDPDWEWGYSYTLSLTKVLGGVGGQRHAPAALLPAKKPGIHFIGDGWAPAPVWTGAENLASTGIPSSDRPEWKYSPIDSTLSTTNTGRPGRFIRVPNTRTKRAGDGILVKRQTAAPPGN